MDNLTQTLVGVALSRLFFKKRVAYATAAMVIAVNLPDLDLLYSWPGIRYIEYHRGILDSVWMIPVWGLLLAWGLRWYTRRHPPHRQPGSNGPLPVPSWAAGFAIGAVGVGVHVLLAWTNTFGVRLLAPFSQHWYALDWTPYWDPWNWFILFTFLGVPMLLGLIKTEVGVVRQNPHRISAALALIVFASYIGLRARQHDAVLDRLNAPETSAYFRGEIPLDWAAIPQSDSPWDWQAVIDLPSQVVVAQVNQPWNAKYDSLRVDRIYLKQPLIPAIQDAEQTHMAQAFLKFARFPFVDAEIPDDDSPRVITITDMRFADGFSRPGVHVAVTMTPGMQITSQTFSWSR